MAIWSSNAFAFVAIVHDPSNMVQNALSALRALKSNLNEAQMIKNQIESLANEMKNLEKLDFSIIDQFSGDMNELFEVTGKIQGLMQDYTDLQSEFQRLYPDFTLGTGFDSTKLVEQATDWLRASRNAVLGAAQTGAKVLESLPRSQIELETLVTRSQGAAGILQAAQAGNQISAMIAGNLQSLNAQLATFTQAQTAYQMRVDQAQAAQSASMKDVLKGWGKRRSETSTPMAGL